MQPGNDFDVEIADMLCNLDDNIDGDDDFHERIAGIVQPPVANVPVNYRINYEPPTTIVKEKPYTSTIITTGSGVDIRICIEKKFMYGEDSNVKIVLMDKLCSLEVDIALSICIADKNSSEFDEKEFYRGRGFKVHKVSMPPVVALGCRPSPKLDALRTEFYELLKFNFVFTHKLTNGNLLIHDWFLWSQKSNDGFIVDNSSTFGIHCFTEQKFYSDEQRKAEMACILTGNFNATVPEGLWEKEITNCL